MQEILVSIKNVSSASFFWWYMSMIISLGMVVGAKFDNRFRGFIKSIILLAPYTLILLLTNISRLYETSLRKELTSDAYNGTASLFMVTIFYMLGLFIGHMIDKQGKIEVMRKYNLNSNK